MDNKKNEPSSESSPWKFFDDELPPDKELVIAKFTDSGGLAIIRRNGNRVSLNSMWIKQERFKCWMPIPEPPKW